jgi:hypothetical protein
MKMTRAPGEISKKKYLNFYQEIKKKYLYR